MFACRLLSSCTWPSLACPPAATFLSNHNKAHQHQHTSVKHLGDTHCHHRHRHYVYALLSPTHHQQPASNDGCHPLNVRPTRYEPKQSYHLYERYKAHLLFDLHSHGKPYRSILLIPIPARGCFQASPTASYWTASICAPLQPALLDSTHYSHSIRKTTHTVCRFATILD